MPKIKDLGINVIPATMRPPEIGPGGAIVRSNTCSSETDCEDTCDPSGQCLPSCEGGTRVPGLLATFSDGAIAQLRQQMKNRLFR